MGGLHGPDCARGGVHHLRVLPRDAARRLPAGSTWVTPAPGTGYRRRTRKPRQQPRGIQQLW